MSADCTKRALPLGWRWCSSDCPGVSDAGGDSVDPDDQQWERKEAADGVSDLQTEMLLKEMQQSSMQMIAELDELETQLEIERVCRESAEVLAVKLSKENRKLRTLSLILQPTGNSLPGDFAQLAAREEESPDPSKESTCHHQFQIKEFQERISQLLEEKKQLAGKVHELEHRLAEVLVKVEKEDNEKRLLQESLEKQNKHLQRISTVSTLVTQEYQELQQNLELEQGLRRRAESYAHQMRVKKQEANRQSVILLENAEPSVQLLKAMEEVAKATRTLEEERFQHQQQVKELQVQIEGSDSQRDIERLRLLLQLADDQQTELEARVQETERRNKELEAKLRDLQEERTTGVGAEEKPANIPPPPPPPPLPPPPSTAPVEPLAELLRRRQKDGKKKTDESADLSTLKVRAVDEMMERIKNGVVLRPTKRRTELTDTTTSNMESNETALDKLQGILGTMGKRRVRQHSLKNEKKQNELDTILLRRRRAMDTGAESQEKRAENPVVPQEVGEPASPGWSRAANVTAPGEGIRRTGCIRQSRRTSAIVALNRRISQERRSSMPQPSLPTEGVETLPQDG